MLDNIYGGGTFKNYSTEEQIIGRQIDGKPLYQKTVDCGVLPSNNTHVNVPVNDSSNMYVVELKGYMTNGAATMTMPRIHENNIKSQIVVLFTNSTGINLYCGNTENAGYHVYITLQYTKTTD